MKLRQTTHPRPHDYPRRRRVHIKPPSTNPNNIYSANSLGLLPAFLTSAFYLLLDISDHRYVTGNGPPPPPAMKDVGKESFEECLWVKLVRHSNQTLAEEATMHFLKKTKKAPREIFNKIEILAIPLVVTSDAADIDHCDFKCRGLM